MPLTVADQGRVGERAGADLATSWRSVLPNDAEIRRARRHLHLKAVVIGLLVASSYWGLVIADSSMVVRLASAAVLVIGLIATATGIMHDANHGAFSSHQALNRVVSYVADGLGTSSWMWRFKHNVLHHGATNIEGVDSDIEQAPFARLSPGQTWHRWHRYQHLYMWPLYGFFTLKSFVVGDAANLLTGRVGQQPLRQRATPSVVIRMTAGKVAHLGVFVVVPLLFNPWWAVLAFYLASSWIVGFVLAVTFQLAHCVDETATGDGTTPHRGADFLGHQLDATADIASPVPVAGHFYRWLVGGLDHQIEHHLAPRLPHTLYPRLGGRLRELCLDAGVRYRRHPGVWAAIRSHERWLRQMGRRPTAPLPA